MIRIALIVLLGLTFAWSLLSNDKEASIQLIQHAIIDQKYPSLSIALLGDFHFTDDPESFDYLTSLLEQVDDKSPDLIALSGDFIMTYRQPPKALIEQIVFRLSAFQKIAPTYAVLGNHDNRAERDLWLRAFETSPINLIENEVYLLDRGVCLKGLGDFSSGYYSPITWPESCDKSTKITLTHDPYVAFLDNNDGIVLAGHTHCGQVKLPFIGAPWTPTKAPLEAQCGKFSDDHKILIVTGGLNTSIISLRLGTQSHWNLITLLNTLASVPSYIPTNSRLMKNLE